MTKSYDYTMHDRVLLLLQKKSSEKKPFTQPQITRKLGMSFEKGSRNTVLNELMHKKSPHVHRRRLRKDERTEEQKGCRLVFWYDASKHNGLYGTPMPWEIKKAMKGLTDPVKHPPKIEAVIRLNCGAIVPVRQVAAAIEELNAIEGNRL